MDLPLLQTLKEINNIEVTHSGNYQPKVINLATFIPKYPNVIIVDQLLKDPRINDDVTSLPSFPRQTKNCANGPVKYERVTNRLGYALESCPPIGEGAARGWTIILKEGLYIFKDLTMNYIRFLRLGLEFVGLEQVRLLFRKSRSDRPLFATFMNELTLNNIRVYDMRKYHVTAGIVILASHKSQLRLTNVFLHSRAAYGVSTYWVSSGFIEDCSFNGCVRAFTVANQSKLRVENLFARDISTHAATVLDKSELNISKSRFVNHDRIILGTGEADSL